MIIVRRIGRWAAAVGLLTTVLAIGGQAAADGRSTKAQTAQDAPQQGVWFGGVDVVTGATYTFDGVIVAFNRDISKDGWALRAYGSRVDFDQDPGDGRGWQGDLMLGYLFNRGAFSGGVYLGADYQNYKLSPDDPTTSVRGTEWGFKVAGDVATSDDRPLYFALAGSYSTAFDSYWSRVRVGHNRNHVIYGIEGSAFGNEDFDAQRLGAFLTFQVPLRPSTPLEVTLAAGHQFANDSKSGSTTSTSTGGGEGTYGSVVFSMPF
jgi:hypothetical protein